MDTDFWLIQKMKRGDENAFDAFVRKHYGEILKYCRYRCPDIAYAEDLTQETFLRFFEKFSNYRHMGKAKNYLYTIAGNLCRDYRKKIREEPADSPDIPITGSIQPESDKILEEITMEAALDSLPEEFREVIALHYFQDMKLSEIADVLQIGLPLVKYRMRQAKRKLEQLLKEG